MTATNDIKLTDNELALLRAIAYHEEYGIGNDLEALALYLGRPIDHVNRDLAVLGKLGLIKGDNIPVIQ